MEQPVRQGVHSADIRAGGAQADTDALAVDQEYRLTLLEAGVDPTIT